MKLGEDEFKIALRRAYNQLQEAGCEHLSGAEYWYEEHDFDFGALSEYLKEATEELFPVAALIGVKSAMYSSLSMGIQLGYHLKEIQDALTEETP